MADERDVDLLVERGEADVPPVKLIATQFTHREAQRPGNVAEGPQPLQSY